MTNKAKVAETIERVTKKLADGLREHARETRDLPEGEASEAGEGYDPHVDGLYDPDFEPPYAGRRESAKVRKWAGEESGDEG